VFFSSWEALARVLVVGTLAYVAMVTSLRISGKRTLAKMNAFDLVVTVALGSILANVLLNKDVALAEGVLGFVLLIALQYIVAWLSVRSKMVQRLVKSEAALLFHAGELQQGTLKRERVTEDEVRAAVRAQGVSGLEQVSAVVLETDGSLTVLPKNESATATALTSVRGVDRSDLR
jgi:uncharacterized membrane protein YcaP (DUF421 family)